MDEVGISINVRENMTQISPRIAQAADTARAAIEKLNTALGGIGGNQDFTQQTTAVQTAQVVQQATRPIAQGAVPRTSAGQQQAIPDIKAALVDTSKSLKDVVELLTDILKVTEDASGTAGKGGQTEASKEVQRSKAKIISPREKEASEDGIAAHIQRGGSFVKTFGRQVANFASTGNAAGSAIGATEGLADTLGKAGPVVAAVAALALGLNALSNQYEGSMESGMNITAMRSRYGNKAFGNNSIAIRTSMEDAMTDASNEGFSGDRGLAVTESLLKSGVSNSKVDLERSNLFKYSRSFGVAPEDLEKYISLPSRLGYGSSPWTVAKTGPAGAMQAQNGSYGILGLASGGVEASGMGTGRVVEYLDSIQKVLENGFDRGISINPEDTAAMLNALSHSGEIWKGQGGARVLSQIGSAMNGATNLQSESDLILFRAARDLTGNASNPDLEARKMLEGAPTAKYMQSAWKEISNLTGGFNSTNTTNDTIQMIKSSFGLSITDSERLAQAMNRGDFEGAKAVYAKPTDTTSSEKDLLRNTNVILNDIKMIGSQILDGKSGFLNTIRQAMDGIVSMTGASASSQLQSFKNGQFMSNDAHTYTMDQAANPYNPNAQKVAEVLAKSKTAGSMNNALNDIQSLRQVANPTQMGQLADLEDLFMGQNYNDLLKGDFSKSPTAAKVFKDSHIDMNDLNDLGALTLELRNMIKAVNTNTTATNANSTAKTTINVQTPVQPAVRGGGR